MISKLKNIIFFKKINYYTKSFILKIDKLLKNFKIIKI